MAVECCTLLHEESSLRAKAREYLTDEQLTALVLHPVVVESGYARYWPERALGEVAVGAAWNRAWKGTVAGRAA